MGGRHGEGFGVEPGVCMKGVTRSPRELGEITLSVG